MGSSKIFTARITYLTRKINGRVIPICIIILLGLLPIMYSKDGLMIFGGDAGGYLIAPVFHLHTGVYIWDTIAAGLGFFNPVVPLSIPYLAFCSFLSILRASPPLSQALLNSAFFMGAGLSMYFLVISLFNRKFRLAAVSSAIFYMFNAHNLLNWSLPGPVTLSVYALYPLLFALFVRGLKTKKILRSGVIFGLGSLIFVTGSVGIPYIVITFFTLVVYFIFHLKFISKNAQDRLNALRFAVIATTVYLLVNLWWIIPLIPSFGEAMQKFASMNPGGWLESFSSDSSVLNLLRLHGYPGWAGYNWGRPTFSYAPTLIHNPFFVAVSFLPPILLGIALVLRSKIRDKIIREKKIFLYLSLFSLLFILSIFLSKGAHEPFGNVYLWLFEHVPGFTIFRSGVVKFGMMMALSLAVLFGASLDIIYRYIRNIRINALRTLPFEKIIVVALVLLVLVGNYPFFTGEVIHSGKGALPSFHHRIPGDYYKTAEWFNNQGEDFNIFSFYGGGGEWVTYDWGKGDTYIGVDMMSKLIHKPIVHAGASENSFAYNVSWLLLNDQTTNTTRLLNLLNVKYTLLHNDSDPKWYGSTPPKVIKEKMRAQKDIDLEMSFGKLDIFRNDNWTQMHIYAPQTLTYVSGGVGDLATAVSFDDFQTRNGLFFSSLSNTKQDEFLLSKSNEILVTGAPAIAKPEEKEHTRDRYVVSENGRYEVLAKSGDWANDEGGKSLSLMVDGKVVAHPTPMLRSDGWVSLGVFSFKKGEPRLSLYLLDENSRDILIEGADIVLRKSKPATKSEPRIIFTKINPTKYKVYVKAAQPFFLVFSESFHPGWEAYIEGEEETTASGGKEKQDAIKFTPSDISYLFKTPVSDEKHFMVNGYANAWYIDPKEAEGEEFTVTLYFKPQSYFYIGLGISSITFLSCIGYLMWDWRQRRKRKPIAIETRESISPDQQSTS